MEYSSDIKLQIDDGIFFDDAFLNAKDDTHPWKIIIADDEKEVHTVTKMVLKNLTFNQRAVEFLSAYSGAETIELIKKHPDTAMILLDVVMERDDTGLEVVRTIRNELGNRLVRIILRTGQAGQVPEKEIINNYDINDYKEKTELTSQKLYTTVTVGLRSYRDLLLIEENKKKIDGIKIYLHNILKSMSSGLIAVNSSFTVTLCNSIAKEMLEVTIDDVIKKTLFEISPFFENIKSDITNALRDHEQKELYKIEFNKNNYFNVMIYPLDFEHLRGLVIRMDNVTEIAVRDEQIKRIQKLETVGTLAAGLAHDFNNILGGISGALSLMKIESANLGEESFIKSGIETIDESVSRASGIIKQLLSISRKNNLKFSQLDLNTVIKNIIFICTTSLDKSIRVETFYYDDPAYIDGDSAQIEQVILNLCINAGHSMTIMRNSKEEWGGVLQIKLYKAQPDDMIYRTYPESTAKEYYVIEVSDTGVGIDETIRNKIFDPFFTTKQKGVGSGLGLSMVYTIVTQHKGFIDVKSAPGKGASFKLYFPATAKAVHISDTISLKKGSGTILVGDDDDPVRTLLIKALVLCGYTVFAGGSGQELLRLYEEHAADIDLVIVDNYMIDLHGSDIFWELKKINAEVKVLFISGLSKTDEIENCLTHGGVGFLPKPLDMESFTSFVYTIVHHRDLNDH